MRVLIVGNGGREHALAWKVSQSPRLDRLYAAPGNAGTARLAENVPIDGTDTEALSNFAVQNNIDLTIIGPEAPLAAGLADALAAAGCRVFGPSRAAAELEYSKAFAKAFMLRHGIPTARAVSFTDFYDAVGHTMGIDFDRERIVIKASGLAAGKGVLLPDCADDAEAALRQIMLDREFGAAGDVVVIEEHLEGEEVSLLAFCDGTTVRPMPPAQDHKRLLNGDMGPNTGGMGAYAPAPACPPEMVNELVRAVLQPAVDGLRAEGRPYVGVLYAGMMLTAEGPRVLEFNCRFGDPETQVILPLLESDLLDVAEACVDGRLAELDIRWRTGAAACVVMAAAGYPGPYTHGQRIMLPQAAKPNTAIFLAGADLVDGQVVTAGGRVLAATAWGEGLETALAGAYSEVDAIHFDGRQFRTDIGHRARSTQQ